MIFLFTALISSAQSSDSSSYRLAGGISYFSNSINGVPGARQGLLGWQASMETPAWRNLRFKLDYSAYTGNNLGAPQHPYFILAGWEYEYQLRNERVFAEALFGNSALNGNWGPNGSPGSSASFATLLGGGVDTPVTKHLAVRVEGGWQHTNFALYESASYKYPYQLPGYPKNFARVSTGLVWTPRPKPRSIEASGPSRGEREPVKSELVFEALGSIGHYHLFTSSTVSAGFHAGGLEYDRNSWGQWLGARMDYVAEVLPVTILDEPSESNIWGAPLTTNREHVAGLAIAPIGLRMLWRDDKRIKPYAFSKGGMIGFTKKVLSPKAGYASFTLQFSVGLQYRLSDRWDLRGGALYFHFSNAFLVPSNPGFDSMGYCAALSYHLGKRKTDI
ncbi:MAG TPA: acyloxyacyl hydrolase [Terracidiphilus sp.]